MVLYTESNHKIIPTSLNSASHVGLDIETLALVIIHFDCHKSNHSVKMDKLGLTNNIPAENNHFKNEQLHYS